MVNKRFWLGILVMVIVFGMMVVGCDNGSTGGGADSALNGAWVSEDEELKLNNGNFEVSEDGNSFVKGTYTTSGNNMKIKITHVHGGMFGGVLESKWYTKAELKSSVIGAFIGDEELNEMFAQQTGTYSVSGNKLTMTMDGETTIYTKK